MSELPIQRIRGARTHPRVSFVVAWQGCPSELSRRLLVWDGWVDDGIDVVVVCACVPDERLRIERAHPGVHVVEATADEPLSALRQRGASVAQGDIVVIIDDSVAWSSTWRDQLPVAPGEVARAPGTRNVGYEQTPRGVRDLSVR